MSADPVDDGAAEDAVTEETADLPPLRPDAERELMHWRSGALIGLAALGAGLVQAGLWALIAPGSQFKIFANGSYSQLPTESTHQFISLAIFVLLGLIAGTWQAVAVWRMRALRGSLTGAVLIGSAAVGALTAWLVGPLLATGAVPGSVGASEADHLVTAPAELSGIAALAAQPLAAAVTWLVLAVFHLHRDLGTGLPQPEPRPRTQQQVGASSQSRD